mmetsp:Transcript_12810/g.37370  ORF Transcript_12810/g.37370 Transcript_12810/m.37370 type:complete len:237 (+) Transcript_12810:585-1295(+)
MAPPPPNLARMRARASAWRRRWRATYCSVVSPAKAADPLESPPPNPPADMDPPPGASYADVGAAWRAGNLVGNGLPSTFAFRRSAYSCDAGSWYFALWGMRGSTLCFFQKATSSSFDECVIILSCLSDHESMVTLLTKEMCTPMPLCAPEHSRHMSAPYVTEAHCGWFEPQSTHLSLPGRILISACMAGVMETAIFFCWASGRRATAPGLSLAHRRRCGSVRLDRFRRTAAARGSF